MHLPVLLLSLILLGMTACRPHEEASILSNPTHQAGVAPLYYALLSSCCNQADIASDGRLSGRQPTPQDTVRFRQGHQFISQVGPRYSEQSVRHFLQRHHLLDSVDWPRLFTPQIPVAVPPFAVGLCRNKLRAVVYTDADTARSNIYNVVTVSEPVALRSGQQLVYYEIGHNPTKMMAGVLLLIVDSTGNRRLVSESMLWMN